MVLNRQNEREVEAHRRDVAMHAKLDELVHRHRARPRRMAGIEELDEEDHRRAEGACRGGARCDGRGSGGRSGESRQRLANAPGSAAALCIRPRRLLRARRNHSIEGRPMIPTGQDSLNTRSALTVGSQALRLLFARQGRRSARRYLPAALLDEGAARESAALRGRRDGHPRRSAGDGRLAEGAQDQPRDPVSPGAGADAGFHRRSGGGRPGRDARRDEAARRRPAEDQPAGPGPSGHRP